MRFNLIRRSKHDVDPVLKLFLRPPRVGFRCSQNCSMNGSAPHRGQTEKYGAFSIVDRIYHTFLDPFSVRVDLRLRRLRGGGRSGGLPSGQSGRWHLIAEFCGVLRKSEKSSCLHLNSNRTGWIGAIHYHTSAPARAGYSICHLFRRPHPASHSSLGGSPFPHNTRQPFDPLQTRPNRAAARPAALLGRMVCDVKRPRRSGAW
jgi:hypothetical protein